MGRPVPSGMVLGNQGIQGIQGVQGIQGPPGPGMGSGAWQASTAYATNQVVQAPDGSIIRRLSAGTSRASFDSTEKALWAAVVGTAGTMDNDGVTLVRTAVKTANYTANLRELVPCDTTSGSFTVTLPAASGGKGRIAIKLVTAVSTLNIALTGSDHINTSAGPTSGTLTLTNQGLIAESDGAGIWTITADDLPLSQLDARFLQPSQVAPIAQAGQTPSQAPLPPGAASVGSLAVVARADHTHPLGTLGRNLMMPTFMDPSWNYDVHLDGTISSFPIVGGGFQNIAKSGSIYTSPTATTGVIYARDFTLDAGVTLRSPQVANTGQGGIVIFATRTITINGTLSVDGPNAAGATGGNGQQNNGGAYVGSPGANGVTGAGAQPTFVNGIGGIGGKGGNSGATAGGGQTNGSPEFGLQFGAQSLLVLAVRAPTNNNFIASGGFGGASGAGDGTNAGGGGGAGGGIILLVAPNIIIGPTAVISAKGGNGANGTGGNAGGGGGGGCGVIAMHALSLSIDAAAVLRNTPGTGGTGAGTGLAGDPGQQAQAGGGTVFASLVLVDPPVANGGRNLGYGFMLRQWQ